MPDTPGQTADVIAVEDPETPTVDASVTEVDAPDAVVDASPTIIVDAGGDDDGASDAEIDRAVETAERLLGLETQMGAVVEQLADIANRVETLNFRQDVAEDIIETQAAEQDAVEDALAETIEEDLELDADGDPDTPPSSAKRHWFFQSWKELRGKS